MKKKILIAIVIFLVFFIVGAAVKTQAGIGDNTTGWLWGGSDDGAGNNTGVGWISANNTNPGAGGSVSYGLNIPPGDGNLSGYAWSENIGWIHFDPAGPYPTTGCNPSPCPTTSVQRSGNNLTGWARIIGIKDALAVGNSGGWQGWIKLGGAIYGVTIDEDGYLGNYAWSDELGYVDFSGISVEQTASLIVCPSSAVVAQGSPSQLRAYYISSGTISCSDTTGVTDVTSDPGTTWTSDDSTIVSVNNSGSITGNSIGGPVNVNATYSGLTASSAVTIISLAFCGDGNTDSGEECDNGASNGPCPATCSDTCAVNDCDSGDKWKEVAP